MIYEILALLILSQVASAAMTVVWRLSKDEDTTLEDLKGFLDTLFGSSDG